MTPKEKAKELMNKYYPIIGGIEPKDWEFFHKSNAKKLAIFHIDEMLFWIDWHPYETPNKEIEFWESVKKEIMNL